MLSYTVNNTTTIVGQSKATVIADTIRNGTRITTLELEYPRYIHSEFMTHRVFSRNASSSRAIPIDITLKEAMFNPVFFDKVCKNQKGMVGGEELSEKELEAFRKDWRDLAFRVGAEVMQMKQRYNIHKQTLNRALEPFLRIRTLVTATDWDNFFKLRLAEDAQPEIRSLATAMSKAMTISVPKEAEYHFPYCNIEAGKEPKKEDIITSVARCARVSYKNNGGTSSTFEEDKRLYDTLLKNKHLSPFEHSAVYFGDDLRYFNLLNWASTRYILEKGIE